MSVFSVDQASGFDSANLFVANLADAQNVRFEGLTSTSGNPLIGEYTRTYSNLVFESGGFTYTYTGNWTQAENRALVTGTVASSGDYSSVTITEGSNEVASYDGSSFHVDFGTSTSVPLLNLVGNLLTLLLLQNAGEGTGAYENLNTDATPDLAATAFAGNDTLTGNDAADTLRGFAGTDTLNGGKGADHMIGGAGNDTYYIDSSYDVVDESVAGSTGSDTVHSSTLSINLAFGSVFKGSVENATLDGFSALSLTGNALNNVLTGNAANNAIFGYAGNDTLDGKGGADSMTGGSGNDTYVIDNVGDVVNESSAGANGSDLVRSSNLSINLGLSGTFQGLVESAALGGNANLNVTGNSLGNYLQGNNGNNLIEGGGGYDTLVGSGGNDTFRFASSLSTTDTIADFNVANDTIQLENQFFYTIGTTGTLSAAAFVSNTTGLAEDASDRIIYESDTGYLYFDSDGSGSHGSYVHFATISSGLNMTAADFVVT